MNERLEAFAQVHGIETHLMSLNGPQGISKGGVIEIDVTAGSSTRVHELAHEIMNHHSSELPPSIKELEAEATAYVVCRHFGLDPKNAPNYIALQQGVTSGMIMEHMERIRVCSNGDHPICRKNRNARGSTMRRNRRYIKPTNPPDSKVPIWSANGDSKDRIELAELVLQRKVESEKL